MLTYTSSEMHDKKYTVNDGIEAARLRVKAFIQRQTGKEPEKAMVCVNSIGRYDHTRPITLVQLNDIADSVYSDTLWYDHGV